MRFLVEVHHHHHHDPALERAMGQIFRKLETLEEKVDRIMATEQEITDLLADATALVEQTLDLTGKTFTEVNAIAADVDRLVASIPTAGGLDEAAANRVRDQAAAVRARIGTLKDAVSALNDAAKVVDDKTPEPPVPTPPVEQPTG